MKLKIWDDTYIELKIGYPAIMWMKLKICDDINIEPTVYIN